MKDWATLNQAIAIGIDLSKFTPETAAEASRLRARMGLGEAFVFLCVGSISRHKRQLAALKSFRCIRDLLPEARLLIAGYPYDAGYLDEISAYIKNSGLGDRVRYIGHAARPELYYLLADAFVHASCYEGGQLALLEALAANLPVISTDVGFTRHFASWPGIHLTDREFPYTRESFTRSGATAPSPSLVAGLALGMLQAGRSKTRPNLPARVIAAFAAGHSYANYKRLVEQFLGQAPQADPLEDWVELLSKTPAADSGEQAPASPALLADMMLTIANYEALVAGTAPGGIKSSVRRLLLPPLKGILSWLPPGQTGRLKNFLRKIRRAG